MIKNQDTFFSVWRNLVIRNVILYHLKLYKKCRRKSFKDIKQFREYKKREYIEKLILEPQNNNQDYRVIREKDIPYSVKHLKLYSIIGIESFVSNNHFNLIKLYIDCISVVNRFTVGLLPLSILELSLLNYKFEIDEIGILPCNLKRFEVLFKEDHYYYLYSNSNIQQKKYLPIEVGCIPESVEHIYYTGFYFFSSLKEGVLPKNLKSIEFSKSFDQTLVPGLLPNSLESIKFGWYFTNKKEPLTKGMLPDSLKSIIFRSFFNTKIEDGALPTSLKYLRFGRCYEHPLTPNTLPLNLESLTLGHKYDTQIPLGILSKLNSLKTLVLGSCYNSIIIPSSLPNSLTFLKFSIKYNQSIDIDSVLPKSLKTLVFNENTLTYNSLIKILHSNKNNTISKKKNIYNLPSIVTININR
ncbi:hypothetical protein RB653_005887 [Dictyostelium firmibasis]|uniref:FNIP repeat-containing protein n=1 Tax=Dictyostelium firmibasis TaxID=79012 RepID=A0AAN7U1Z1_9MYCE